MASRPMVASIAAVKSTETTVCYASATCTPGRSGGTDLERDAVNPAIVAIHTIELSSASYPKPKGEMVIQRLDNGQLAFWTDNPSEGALWIHESATFWS